MQKILFVFMVMISCGYYSPAKSSISLNKGRISALAQQIANNHFGDFFNYAIQEDVMDRIWAASGENSKPLEQIILDQEAPNKARLIATEILLQQDFTIVGKMDMSIVTRIYTTALAENTTEMANSWGFLYEEDDMGPIGGTFSFFGKDALPALVELLDNKTIHLYDGSEEATVGNDYQFQVRDFAAFYISQILNEPSPYQEDRAARNKEIERLRALVKNRQK